MQAAATPTAGPSIEFHFTYAAVLERGAAAATAEWTARCVAGGEFAEAAGGYAPDARIPLDERTRQAAKFDRQEFVRIATDAWQRANASLPQGPLRVCVDLVSATDGFTRDVMGGVVGVTAGGARITLRIHPDAEWRKALPYGLAHEMHHS